MKLNYTLTYLPLLIAVALLSSIGCSTKGQSQEEGKDGTFAGLPNITLPDLSGKQVSFSDFKGKVVILDFWATWCGPCVAEIPHFKTLYEKYHDRGLEIVGVSVDVNAAKVVPPFVEEHEIPYTILLGNAGLQRKFNLRGLPTTYVIDRKGRVVEKLLGYRGIEVFEKLVEPLLNTSS